MVHWPVCSSETTGGIGTILLSLLIGLLGYDLFDFVGLPLPFLYCLLFGALISSTDPIALPSARWSSASSAADGSHN
ncbi:MAG: hypothetical protein A4E19_10845 [Nitrospira sp. SG-bin1]|nr:MAG: hypothetical protein A4E19_10845 [Nitrospira sp. SG-bin1]